MTSEKRVFSDAYGGNWNHPDAKDTFHEPELQDETMHSGADVDAFTAALNRDIEGNKSTSQPLDSDSAHLSQGSNFGSNQSASQWPSSSQEKLTNPKNQQDMSRFQRQEPHMPAMAGNRLQNPPNQPQPQRVQNHQVAESQFPMATQNPATLQKTPNQQTVPTQNPANMQKTPNQQTVPTQNPADMQKTPQQTVPIQNPANMQKTPNQQTVPTQNPANTKKTPKQVSFGELIPVIVPHLDKEKNMQLQTLYVKLRRNEVPKEGFLRLMKEIVGDKMIKMALYQLQQQGTRTTQAGSSSSQVHQNPSSAPQLKVEPNVSTNAHGSQQINTVQGLNKQQQHFHFSQGGFPINGTPGGNNNRPLPGSNVNSPTMRQGPGQIRASNQPMNNVMEQKRNNLPVTFDSSTGAVKDKSQMGFSSSMSNAVPSPVPRSITAQLNSQIPNTISSVGPGNDAKPPPPRKPLIGQKNPHDSLVSSPPQPSKKQKVSGALADQSIEQLNDVTAVSGVNLREEEEQLFSEAYHRSKEDSRASEASQRVAKEEEERLILQKSPLRNKLKEIMSKCGVKNISGDVERCLSLSVEERLRGLISSLIRLSKQRADVEKSRHRTIITSDVRKQILAINQKAKEEWDKKQAEAGKLRNPDESEGSDEVDGDKEKEDGRGKSLKQTHVNKDEDDKMRTTAANVAARAAVGGDDMLSKWQIMAEQARQKREGGSDVAISSQQGKDISSKPPLSVGKTSKDISETAKGGQQNASAGFGSSKKSTRSQIIPQPTVTRSISVKDMISVLEREPQMSKGVLLYRLYEKSDPILKAE